MRKFFLVAIVFIFFIILVGKSYPISAAAPIGNYLVLNGGYVKTTSSNNSSPNVFSFRASINPASVSGKQIILSIGDKSTGKLYYEVGINGGALSLDYNYNNGSHISITSGNLTSGSWHDIAVEISSTQTKLFIDGLPVFSPFINNDNLSAIGPNIVVSDTFKESFPDSKPYKGLLDEVSISNGSNLLLWHLDEARGVTVASDSSGNNLNGALIGGDSFIHFFGVLPSPTPTPTPVPFGLPPIRWIRPILPTLSFPFPPSNSSPTNSPTPSDSIPVPTTPSIRNIPRSGRGLG